jgi:hypothetical protein
MDKDLTIFRYRLKEGVKAALDATQWARAVYETHPNPLVGKRSLEELALYKAKITELESLIEEVAGWISEEEKTTETFEMRGVHKQSTELKLNRFTEMVRVLLANRVTAKELVELISKTGNVVEIKRGDAQAQ